MRNGEEEESKGGDRDVRRKLPDTFLEGCRYLSVLKVRPGAEEVRRLYSQRCSGEKPCRVGGPGSLYSITHQRGVVGRRCDPWQRGVAPRCKQSDAGRWSPAPPPCLTGIDVRKAEHCIPCIVLSGVALPERSW
ncbi:hypothetical protein NDU88_002748 [Pleurodeles waltl]|uniref:Uncharacterized protein n=1 Tax=Pleurodeles waltl TaxID=8319 RepID=A0AAV7SEG2_PLEWA|nr:hypothetical protein NDU88_002748 [Pleurodeles waltl]